MNNNSNVKVLTKDLAQALSFASGIVEKRYIKPILGNVKLETKNNQLILTASSLELALCVNLGCESSADCTTTVNLVTFLDIVRKLNDKILVLNIDLEKNQIEVIGESFKSNLSTLPASEFPALENFESIGEFKLPAKNLLRLLTHTEFAMSNEETRYNLNGVFLNSKRQNLLNSTAIDGHRMASASCDVEGLNLFGLILPKKTTSEFIKILKDSLYLDHEAFIEYNVSKICLKINNLTLTSKLTDATFPDYELLLPVNNNNKLTIHSNFISEIVDRVATVTHDKFRAIKIVLNSNQIVFSAFGESKGTADEVIKNTPSKQLFSYEGEEITIGFNPKYLLDVLRNFDDVEMELFFKGSTEPILVKTLNFPDDQYVIMPMKV